MAWIESHQSLRDHRKLLRLASLLRADRHRLIGHLHCLWWWALDNIPPSGDLGNISDEELSRAAEWSGNAKKFVQSLSEAGFIDIGTSRHLHNWDIYGGRLQARRIQDRDRKRVRRTSRGHPTEFQQTSIGFPEDVLRLARAGTQPNPTVPNPTEEKRDGAPSAPWTTLEEWKASVTGAENRGQKVKLILDMLATHWKKPLGENPGGVVASFWQSTSDDQYIVASVWSAIEQAPTGNILLWIKGRLRGKEVKRVPGGFDNRTEKYREAAKTDI